MADIVEGLRNGERLQRPGDCPDQMHDLCTRCWVTNPARRPTFAQVNDELQILPAILRNTPATGATRTRTRGDTAAGHTGYESEAHYSKFLGAGVPRPNPGAPHGSYMDEPVMNPAFGTTTSPGDQQGDAAENMGGGGGARAAAAATDVARPRARATVLTEASGYTGISKGEIGAATAALDRETETEAEGGPTGDAVPVVPTALDARPGTLWVDPAGTGASVPAPESAQPVLAFKQQPAGSTAFARGKQASVYLGFAGEGPGGEQGTNATSL